MRSPSTWSVAIGQPTSPAPTLGTTRRPVNHSSCGVNPCVKAPASCRAGTSCLHSPPREADSLGAVGACVHIARQSRMRSVVLENRSAAEHHSANLIRPLSYVLVNLSLSGSSMVTLTLEIPFFCQSPLRNSCLLLRFPMTLEEGLMLPAFQGCTSVRPSW